MPSHYALTFCRQKLELWIVWQQMCFSFRCAGVNSRAIRGRIYWKLTFITVIIAIHQLEVAILYESLSWLQWLHLSHVQNRLIIFFCFRESTDSLNNSTSRKYNTVQTDKKQRSTFFRIWMKTGRYMYSKWRQPSRYWVAKWSSWKLHRNDDCAVCLEHEEAFINE